MKTIIHVWTHKVCNLHTDNVNNFWGIGDIIRGTIRLYQLCKKYNFRYIVDIQHHPVSNFLNNKNHEYSDLIKENKNNIKFVQNTEEYIINSKDEVLFFITNDLVKDEIDNDCKNFIKEILTPNEDFQKYINDKIREIPFEKYNILHYRLGDEELIRNNQSLDYKKYKDNLIKNLEKNDILLSDSKKFKILNKDLFFSYDTNICHLGYHSDEDMIKDTLFEFFVISKSNKIKTYSVHSWISGFVNWIHIIYDIPLYKL